MSNQELTRRLELARQVAVEAGEVTLKHFMRPGLEVQIKADGSPLTVADQQSERWLRQRIEAAFPDDAIVGEEFGEQPGQSGFQWVLDPIDGTKSFVNGVPLYGTMVGVVKDGQPVAGSIWFPGLGEGMFAANGHGAWHVRGTGTPTRAAVREPREPSRRLLLTTCERTLEKRMGTAAWKALGQEFGISRTWGDVYGYLLVATGRADVMIDPYMNVWDAAAVMPIVTEAGGCFSDWTGAPRIDGGDSVASSGKELHERVLKLLR